MAKDVLQRNLADASSVDVSIKTDEYQLATARYKDDYTNHIPTLSLFFQQALEEVQYDYNGALLGFSLNWKIFSGLRDYNENRSSYYRMLTARSDLSISQQSYDIKVAEWTSSLLANRKKCRSREAS